MIIKGYCCYFNEIRTDGHIINKIDLSHQQKRVPVIYDDGSDVIFDNPGSVIGHVTELNMDDRGMYAICDIKDNFLPHYDIRDYVLSFGGNKCVIDDSDRVDGVRHLFVIDATVRYVALIKKTSSPYYKIHDPVEMLEKEVDMRGEQK